MTFVFLRFNAVSERRSFAIRLSSRRSERATFGSLRELNDVVRARFFRSRLTHPKYGLDRFFSLLVIRQIRPNS